MKIVILGSTGMNGSTVSKYFLEKYGEDVVYLSYRGNKPPFGKNHFFLDAANNWIMNLGIADIAGADYVINCIGIIKPLVKVIGIENTIKINSLFPYEMARYCNAVGAKLINITTDCVYSGSEGLYDERYASDAEDEYGKSKSLGEPDTCMNIRTSIIGEELQGNAKSLVEWAKSQRGKEVKGFVNHLWNGVTTLQYAKICDQIIEKGLYETGTFHVFSHTPVSKYELLAFLNDRFQLNLKIIPEVAPKQINRTLATIKDLTGKLDIPEINKQILEM